MLNKITQHLSYNINKLWQHVIHNITTCLIKYYVKLTKFIILNFNKENGMYHRVNKPKKLRCLQPRNYIYVYVKLAR